MTSTIQALPAVQCAPWCTDGKGHASAIHPDDQCCMSESMQIPMTRVKTVEYESGTVGLDARRGLDHMTLYVLREFDHRHATVQLGRGDAITSPLTPAEAQQLGHALIAAAEMAMQS